jgi:hypothetical protein
MFTQEYMQQSRVRIPSTYIDLKRGIGRQPECDQKMLFDSVHFLFDTPPKGD